MKNYLFTQVPVNGINEQIKSYALSIQVKRIYVPDLLKLHLIEKYNFYKEQIKNVKSTTRKKSIVLQKIFLNKILNENFENRLITNYNGDGHLITFEIPCKNEKEIHWLQTKMVVDGEYPFLPRNMWAKLRAHLNQK